MLYPPIPIVSGKLGRRIAVRIGRRAPGLQRLYIVSG